MNRQRYIALTAAWLAVVGLTFGIAAPWDSANLAHAQDGGEASETAPTDDEAGDTKAETEGVDDAEPGDDDADEDMEKVLDAEGALEEEEASALTVTAPGTETSDEPLTTTGAPDESKIEALFVNPIPAPQDADAATAAEYKAYRAAAERYYREVKEYRHELNTFLKDQYEAKIEDIDRTYQTRINELRDEIGLHRAEAIARMEGFLEKHPNNDRYTPGVLYRLAVLHYEKADAEFLAADPATLTTSHPDFSKAIKYAEALIDRYPEFDQIDGAFYLLGFSHQEMNNDERARDIFMRLAEEHPDSPKAPEALTRIGEFYFARSQAAIQGSAEDVQWDRAKKFYERAVSYGPDYAIYDRALYRLAWTDYYKEDFDSMIKRFIELVEYADKVPQGSSLRTEAIEFMAAVLAEEDWNLQDDISTDPEFGMTRFDKYLNTGQPFELEVLRVYADTLAEQSRYNHAADAYSALLERDPCNPENPRIHQAYISSLNLAGQRDKAVEVQSELDEIYGEGSEWYACQEREGNLEAIAYAESMARKALKFSIATYYTRANELFDEVAVLENDLAEAPSDAERQRVQAELQLRREETREAYRLAARKTKDYLQRYPNDKDVYTYRYILADAYYAAGDYAEAADAFAEVRDMADGRRRRDAATGAIDSRTLVLSARVDEGTGDPLGLPPYLLKEKYMAGQVDEKQTPSYILREVKESDPAAAAELERRGDRPAVEPKPFAPEVEQLVEARSKYIEYDLDARRKPDQQPLEPEYLYANAMAYYHHDKFEEARKRFNELIDEHPQTQYARLSAGFIVESYDREGNLDMVASEATRFSKMELGSGEDGGEESAEIFGELATDAIFEKASNYYDQERYAEAAAEFERIVDQNPDYDDIHLALYNAGVAYEEIKRYDSAVRLYKRLYDEYNETTEAADALYRIGFNAQRFFDFDTAVESYVELHESDREAFLEHEKRPTALRQAAVIRKYTEEHEEAGKLFEQYHDEHRAQPDSPDLLFEAGVMYERAGDYSNMSRIFDKFRERYGDDPAYREKVLDTYVRQGDYFKERGDERRARRFYDRAATLYRSNPDVGGRGSNWLAAKALFEIADIEFQEWSELSIRGSSVRVLKKRIDKKKAESKDVAAKFNQVLLLENPEWSMASLYRIGSMFHNFATTLENAECPPRMDEDVCAGLKESFIEGGLELKTLARKEYEKVVAFGKEHDVVNDWTRRSLNGLNDIAPKEYPLFEGERSALRAKTSSPTSLMPASEAGQQRSERDAPKGLDDESLEEK